MLLPAAALVQNLLGQHPPFAFDPVLVAAMMAMFLLDALHEEVGWRGYV